MAQNTSITLGDHFQEFTSHLVREGRYGSVSEVVRAGLRLLEEHEAKAKVLRQAIEEGEKSGFPDEPFDFDAFLTRMQGAFDRVEVGRSPAKSRFEALRGRAGAGLSTDEVIGLSRGD